MATLLELMARSTKQKAPALTLTQLAAQVKPQIKPQTQPQARRPAGFIPTEDAKIYGLSPGTHTQIQGSGSSPYTIKCHPDGVYSCTCPAWRNQSKAPDQRTCKHIRSLTVDLPARPAEFHRASAKPQAPRARAQRVVIQAPKHPLEGVTVCMTGFRDADMEAAIVAAGGAVASAVTKHLGILVAKDPMSASGKAQKARELGVRVVGIPEMNQILKSAVRAQARAAIHPQPPASTGRSQAKTEGLRVLGDPIGGGVLLAEKWTPDVDPTGCWMSEKLDGVRAYWNGEAFYSRNGNMFAAPAWFTDLLPKNVSLDGELYVGPGLFDETISIVRSGTPDPVRWKKIRYMVFDLPNSPAPFEARVAQIHQIVTKICLSTRGFCPIIAVDQTLCRSPAHLGEFHAEVVGRGIEGTMLRTPGSPYTRRRSRDLLKVKDFHDAEAVIVGYVAGEGKHKGRLGAYEVETLDTRVGFRVGTGLSDRDRERKLPLGTIITYRYQELNPTSGAPRFPSFVRVRGKE